MQQAGAECHVMVPLSKLVQWEVSSWILGLVLETLGTLYCL